MKIPPPLHSTAAAIFGAWTVIGRVDERRVLCRCVCGIERACYRSNLTSRKSLSCGCQKPAAISAALKRHGMFGTLTYQSWSSMLTRCTNGASRSFAHYGARGITVCERWRSFENFLADMGEKPGRGWSIERIDNERGYEPANCKWATAQEQSRNTRRTRLTSNDVAALRAGAVSAAELAERTGASMSTVLAARRGQNWKTP